jgi:hypothetical protein
MRWHHWIIVVLLATYGALSAYMTVVLNPFTWNGLVGAYMMLADSGPQILRVFTPPLLAATFLISAAMLRRWPKATAHCLAVNGVINAMGYVYLIPFLIAGLGLLTALHRARRFIPAPPGTPTGQDAGATFSFQRHEWIAASVFAAAIVIAVAFALSAPL